jgi:hypothetical protein
VYALVATGFVTHAVVQAVMGRISVLELPMSSQVRPLLHADPQQDWFDMLWNFISNFKQRETKIKIAYFKCVFSCFNNSPG